MLKTILLLSPFTSFSEKEKDLSLKGGETPQQKQKRNLSGAITTEDSLPERGM